MPVTAQIIPFPEGRARRSIRQLLIQTSQAINDACQSEEWRDSGQDITPGFVLSQLPAETELATLDDLELAQIAIRTSLLGLHAIHDGAWDNRDHMPLLLELQTSGLRIEAAPAYAGRKAS